MLEADVVLVLVALDRDDVVGGGGVDVVAAVVEHMYCVILHVFNCLCADTTGDRKWRVLVVVLYFDVFVSDDFDSGSLLIRHPFSRLP